MENLNVLSQKSGKSDCQTRVRQTITHSLSNFRETDPRAGDKDLYGMVYGYLYYRIRPIKRTMRVQVGKFFCSRGFVKHSYNRTPPMSADRDVIYRNKKRPIDGSYGRHLYILVLLKQ